jgi:uridine kinase
MFEEIIAPSQYYADLIINNDGASNKSIDVLVSVLQDLLAK